MHLRRCVSLIAVALLLVIAVSCARRAPAPAPPPPAPPAPAPAPAPPPPPPPPPPPAPAPAPRPLTEEERFQQMSLDELNAQAPLGDVFFDYDMSVIRPDQQGTLQQNAQYLQRWTSTRITVEGHADSRGTNEYNLALGERRAAAVRDYLASLGVAADRIQVVSRGEESPLCTEENEACWSRNRRGHFVFTAK